MTPRQIDDDLAIRIAQYELGYWLCAECDFPAIAVRDPEPLLDAHIARTNHAVHRKAAVA